LPTLFCLTESKSLAGLASGSGVLARAEVVVLLDGVAILVRELRGERVLDAGENVALDEDLGACLVL
jgi:hypothetical protein